VNLTCRSSSQLKDHASLFSENATSLFSENNTSLLSDFKALLFSGYTEAFEIMRSNCSRPVFIVTADINLQNKCEVADFSFIEPPEETERKLSRTKKKK